MEGKKRGGEKDGGEEGKRMEGGESNFVSSRPNFVTAVILIH